MSNVISLAAVRRAQQVAPLIPMDYAKMVDKIMLVAPGYVSAGAAYLLLQIARLLRDGHNELSYTYLCTEFKITDKTVAKYITELEDAEFLRVRRSRIGKTAATNQFEIDFKGPLGGEMPALKMPKKFNEMGTGKIPVGGGGVPEKLQRYNINIDSNKKLIPKGIGRSAAPGFETISDAITFSEKRITRRRAEKVAKATRPGSQLTLAGVKATWAAAMLKHYPSVPPVSFTQKDFAIFKAKVQPLLATCNLSELFDYIVSSWQALRETKFVWLRVKGKDVALAPSLPEMMRYWKIFAQAFADSRMAETTNDIRAKRTEVEELEDKLAAERAEKAKIAAERAKLQERLAKAERMAYAKPSTTHTPEPSLSERQKKLADTYNDDTDLPDWR